MCINYQLICWLIPAQSLNSATCTNYSGCVVPQNTITLPPGFQLPPGAVIVKNEAGQYMVVSGPQPQVQQQQIPHMQQQTSTSAILPQQYKFNTVRVCIQTVTTAGQVQHQLFQCYNLRESLSVCGPISINFACLRQTFCVQTCSPNGVVRNCFLIHLVQWTFRGKNSSEQF